MYDIEIEIENIGNKFIKDINGNKNLCHLMNLTFEENNIPNYSLFQISSLYLLRYLYAYSFECLEIFSDVFKLLKSKSIKNNLNVLSIGSGSGFDFHSIQRAARENSFTIKYTGVDIVDWPWNFGENRFVSPDWINEIDFENFNTFFFPKSIGELADGVFLKLLNFIENSEFDNDVIVVASAHRESRCVDDQNRLRKVGDVFLNKGYNLITESDRLGWKWTENNGIRFYRSDYIYHQETLNKILNLKSFCNGYTESNSTCKYQCNINRYPILKTGIFQYGFEVFVK